MRALMTIRWQLPLILLFLWITLPQSAQALTASQVYEQVKDSVLVVKAYDQKGKPVGLGSGVLLPSGHVITNYHVVKAGVRYMVAQGKQGVPATLKSGDPDKDLCLLTAPGLAAKPARLGQAAKLKVGDPVYAVGAPQGLELSLSEGIVSQLRGGHPPIIQTTVAISPGSSGGGLFNVEGELVGITTFYLKDSQSLNFALPVEWIGQVAKGNSGMPIGAAPVAPVPGTAPKEGWEKRAVALEKAKDWQGLSAFCRQWLRTEPDNDLASKWFMLASCFLRTQDEPKSAGAWFSLGDAYSELGRYGEAKRAYRKSLSFEALLPGLEALTWACLGDTYSKLESNKEAIEAYRQALRIDPRCDTAWLGLGNFYAKLSRHQEAVEAYREALGHNPLREHSVTAWSGLALSYAQLGNRSAALEAVKELRRYDPKKAEELFNLIIKQ
ncbi:MAG: serine protease [Deltaproteobacteria bacterium]|nr:serine protease [Deltaproteobacteria bacterium]